MIEITKKDGSVVPFQLKRAERSVRRAMSACEVTDEALVTNILEGLEKRVATRTNVRPLATDWVQVYIELQLMKSSHKDVATAYIETRSALDRDREGATDVNYMVKRLIDKDKSVTNENANKDSRTFSTQRDLTAGSVAKAIGMKRLPKRVANAHRKGEIHVHDLDYNPYTPMSNCCLIDFEFMLSNGFTMGNAEIEPPKSIGTATAQVAQIIANVASSQYGGCSFNRMDEVLAPYAEMNYTKHYCELLDFYLKTLGVRDDVCVTITVAPVVEEAKRRTIKDIYDAMQALEYEINTLFSSNGQTPFVTVNFGLGTSQWEREIQKAVFNVRIKGLGKEGRTAIFPKIVYGIKKGVNFSKEDPNYDIKQLALDCSIARMYPDILNYDKLVELTGSYKAPMGCRSFLQSWVDKEGNEVSNGRMNLGVVTLNLPRIAIESEGDQEAFSKLLEDKLKLVEEALVFRMNSVFEAKPEMAPVLYKYGAFGANLEDGEDVTSLFRDLRATISIGYIGLYEVGTVFFGPDWEGNPKAKSFTLGILKRLKDRSLELSEEHGVWFSVYGTPAESLTDRFCRMDREKYGDIPNITDKDYYTNSFHYDVRKSPNPYEKIDFEKDYPAYASGGFIHYVEYPKLGHNRKALEAVWDYSYDRVAYLGTNTPIDKCHLCKFEGEFTPISLGYKCPKCGNQDPATCDVVKRQCGYLGQPQARPNAYGRKKEIDARVKHVELED